MSRTPYKEPTIVTRIGLEYEAAEKPADPVDEGRDVLLTVRVDAEDDFDRLIWHCVSRCSFAYSGDRRSYGRDGGQDTQGAGQSSYQVTSVRPVAVLIPRRQATDRSTQGHTGPVVGSSQVVAFKGIRSILD